MLKISLDHPEKHWYCGKISTARRKPAETQLLLKKTKVPAGSHNARRRERVFSVMAHKESCAQSTDFIPFKAENLKEQPPKILQWVEWDHILRDVHWCHWQKEI